MRGYLNSWDIKGIFEIRGYLNVCCTGGSGSFSVQVSSTHFWCDEKIPFFTLHPMWLPFLVVLPL